MGVLGSLTATRSDGTVLPFLGVVGLLLGRWCTCTARGSTYRDVVATPLPRGVTGERLGDSGCDNHTTTT